MYDVQPLSQTVLSVSLSVVCLLLSVCVSLCLSSHSFLCLSTGLLFHTKWLSSLSSLLIQSQDQVTKDYQFIDISLTTSRCPETMTLFDDVDSDILRNYHEFSLASLVYWAMKESSTSEQSARMTSMDAASKNAGMRFSVYLQLACQWCRNGCTNTVYRKKEWFSVFQTEFVVCAKYFFTFSVKGICNTLPTEGGNSHLNSTCCILTRTMLQADSTNEVSLSVFVLGNRAFVPTLRYTGPHGREQIYYCCARDVGVWGYFIAW